MQALPIRLLIQTKHTKSATAHTKRRNKTGKPSFFRIYPLSCHASSLYCHQQQRSLTKTCANSHTSKDLLSQQKCCRRQKKEADAPSQHRSANQKAVKTQKNRRATPQKKAHSHLHKSKKVRYFHQQTALTTPSARQKNGLFPRQNSHSRKTYSIFVKQGKNYRLFV